MKISSVALIALLAVALGCSDKSPTTPKTPTTPTTPSPPPPAGQGLSGFVRDRDTNAPLEGARVEIVDAGLGALTGHFVLTDASGRYDFAGISGSQSFRAARSGYEGEPRRIHLALTSTADFALMPLSSLPPRETIAPGEAKMRAVTGSDGTCGGLFFILPCKRFILVSEGATLKARLTWQNADDIDLELWRNDLLVTASLTCQACGLGSSQEEINVFIPAGEYELRATLYAGNGGSFTLSVTRDN